MDIQEPIVIPFSFDAYQGLATTQGLLSMDENYMYFEFQTYDALVGIIKTNVKKLKIPLNKIASIELNKKFFGTRLIIKATSLSVFQHLVTSKHNEFNVKIKRRDANLAQLFAEKARYYILEYKINELDK